MITSELLDSYITRITIDRPESANSLPECGKRELAEEIERYAADSRTRALLLTGSGDRAFCAGSDIKEMKEFDAPAMRRMLGAERAMYRAILEAPKPVVAAVNGHALGAGCVLVLCCDYVVAANRARFGMPELTIGVAAPLEALLLPLVVGLTRARGMFNTGQHVDAERALEWGLVNETAPDDAFEEAALRAARTLASLPSEAFRIQKSLLCRLVSLGGTESVIEASRDATSLQFVGSEPKQAIETFLSRR